LLTSIGLPLHGTRGSEPSPCGKAALSGLSDLTEVAVSRSAMRPDDLSSAAASRRQRTSRTLSYWCVSGFT